MDSTLSLGKWWLLIILASVCSLLLACTTETPEVSRMPAEVPEAPVIHDQGPAEEVILTEEPRRQNMLDELDRVRADVARTRDAIENNADRIAAYPNMESVSVAFLWDSDGNRDGTIGIVVWVTELVPDDEIPESLRLPDPLDGVPVQIRKSSNVVYSNPS